MELPPGPLYIICVLLQALPVSVVTYILHWHVLGINTPKWLLFVVVPMAHLAFKLMVGYWRAYRCTLDAATRGAVLIPQVQEGGFQTRAAMVRSMQSYPGEVFQHWREQYGETFKITVLLETRVVTFEPEHIKAILVTQFEDFHKGPVVYNQLHGFLGSGVFNSDGDMWKFHRSMTRPFFNKERITDFDIFDRHALDAIGQAGDRLAAGYPIDFQDMASRFTIDSATEFLFGKDVCTLSAGLLYPPSSPLANSLMSLNHPSNVFVDAFMTGQHLTTLRGRNGPAWPLMEFWKDNVKPRRKVVDEFIEPILTEALAKEASGANITDTKDASDDHQTLLTYLVRHTNDRQVLLDELVNLLVAGRDTTSSTLTFAAYMLTQHPDIVRRLREEILSTVGRGRPTFEQMKEMKYLRAFINETLRLYPAVPLNNRTANKATTLPPSKLGDKPFYVPADTKVMYGVFSMHRRKDLWGLDAELFDPDRFLDERLHKYLIPNPFIFLPFNAGPRICLGQQFAYHEISLFLVRLLQRFSEFSFALDTQPKDSLPPPEWSKCSGTKGTDKIMPRAHLTLYVKGGLWVRMEDENSAPGSISEFK